MSDKTQGQESQFIENNKPNDDTPKVDEPKDDKVKDDKAKDEKTEEDTTKDEKTEEDTTEEDTTKDDKKNSRDLTEFPYNCVFNFYCTPYLCNPHGLRNPRNLQRQ